jgi:selenocysteine lyase/cysteine desulfurase
MPFDLTAIRPDFLVTVGYKWLLGPFGVGYLYVAEQHRDGEPIEHNWILREGSEDFARLVDYRDEYQPGARRFDVGERTKFELVPMAVAALEQILRWRVERIASALEGITARLEDDGRALGFAPVPRAGRGPHLLGLRLPPGIRGHVLEVLSDAGCHASVRGDALRLAPHLHVTAADLERLVGALASLAGR